MSADARPTVALVTGFPRLVARGLVLRALKLDEEEATRVFAYLREIDGLEELEGDGP